MEDMIRCANPGLKRRFQIETAFVFKDYDDDALLQILLDKAKRRGIDVNFEVAKIAVSKVLAKQRMKPHFGNGGAVDNLLSTAVTKFEQRTKDCPKSERLANKLIAEDFYTEPEHLRHPERILDGLIGCDAVRERITQYQAQIEAATKMGRDPLENMELTFKFVGAPGTGKTTCARRMGQLFESLGLLPSADFKQVSAAEFSTGYVGQAARHTRGIFEQALGGVLFIDEAYRLHEPGRTGYMKEVVDEIVNLLTEEKFQGNMVVIFAGYEHDIEEMMSKVNPGLKSRVTQTMLFEAFDATAATELLLLLLKKKGLEVCGTMISTISTYAQQLVNAPCWASGRDVETWAKRIANECARTPLASASVSEASVETATNSMLREREKVARAAHFDDISEAMPMGASMESVGCPAPTIEASGGGARKKVAEDTEVETVFALEKAHDGGEDPISAALQEACVALGYDEDLSSRRKLLRILTAATTGAELSEDIMKFVCEATNASRTKVSATLRLQVPAMLHAITAAIQYEEDRLAELARLDEEERQKAIAREHAVQQKLAQSGICPAGFKWHREGSGWRCGGGAHYVDSI